MPGSLSRFIVEKLFIFFDKVFRLVAVVGAFFIVIKVIASGLLGGQLLPGYKLIWLNFIIFALVLIWQSRSLAIGANLIQFNEDKQTSLQVVFTSLLLIGTIIASYFFIEARLDPLSPRWQGFGDKIVFYLVLYIGPILIGFLATGIVYSFLYLGTLSLGVGICLAIHNWANGGDFHIGIVVDLLLQGISDFAEGFASGWFSTITVFLWSILSNVLTYWDRIAKAVTFFVGGKQVA